MSTDGLNTNKIIIAVASIGAIVGFLVGAYYITGGGNPTQEQQVNSLSAENARVKENDQVKWSERQENILIKYSDFQCPACASIHTRLIQIAEQNPEVADSITFVYRHFPLETIHPNAMASARAAEAAGLQGKFYDMNDMLFTRQRTWSAEEDPQSLFEEYAQELELDVEEFIADYNSEEVLQKVREDQTSGLQAGIDSTPTLFLNGREVDLSTVEMELLNVATEQGSPTATDSAEVRDIDFTQNEDGSIQINPEDLQ